MKVLLTRSTAVKGEHLEAGLVHEVDDAIGVSLINQGRGTEATDGEACPPTPPKAKKAKKAKVLEEVEIENGTE
tara:strand:- start:8393 stop:8614 length:222 start_codon:yes stop_codon:yes gene_type:complete